MMNAGRTKAVVCDFNPYPYEVRRVENARSSTNDTLASLRRVVRGKRIDPHNHYYKDEVKRSLTLRRDGNRGKTEPVNA
jgi:hypothetical protein